MVLSLERFRIHRRLGISWGKPYRLSTGKANENLWKLLNVAHKTIEEIPERPVICDYADLHVETSLAIIGWLPPRGRRTACLVVHAEDTRQALASFSTSPAEFADRPGSYRSPLQFADKTMVKSAVV
jgi:hypothetical protein